MLIYNEEFTVKKVDKYWKVYHVKTNSFVLSSKSKKEALKQSRDIILVKGEAEVKKAIKRAYQIMAKNKFWQAYRVQKLFSKTFGVPLNGFISGTMLAVDQVYALDVISFDEWLKTPEGISMKDYILQKYGKTALELVLKLM